jgi:hypothetical protein
MKTGFYDKYKDLLFSLIILWVAISFLASRDGHLTEAILMLSIGVAYLLSFFDKLVIKRKLGKVNPKTGKRS